jgi:hypothetical protein
VIATGKVAVSGGPSRIVADPDELVRLSRAVDALSVVASRALVAASSTSVNPARAVSALANPLDAAAAMAANARLVEAMALLGAAVAQAELLSGQLRLAAECYRSVDRLRAQAVPAARSLARLPAAGSALAHGDLARFIYEDPELAGAVVMGASVAVSNAGRVIAPAMPAMPAIGAMRGMPVEDAARRLSGLYREHPVQIVPSGPDRDVDRAGPPRDLTGLIAGLTRRNEQGDGGAIDVRVLTRTGSDGIARRSVIVDITGTKEWNLPFTSSATVADAGTNLHALAGVPTGYQHGVEMALEQAGVTADEPVMLVGHSQGGMVATRLATSLRTSGRFNVTHVVTAGSPIGAMDLPHSVIALSLENRGDVVPQLDGADNPHRANRYTVGVDRGGQSLASRHSLTDGYLPAAVDVDASHDPALGSWYASAQPFLTGDEVQTMAYQVRPK